MPEQKEVYWSRFAETFDEDQKYIVGETVQQAVIGRLSEERNLGKVIELGCGRGFFTKAVASNAEQVLATDLSDEMVEMASKELKGFGNVTVQKADGENTAFPAGGFDTVVMVNVVHFMENPERFLRESYRLLRDAGLLLVADYTGYGTKHLEMMKMGIRFLRRWGMPPRYARARRSLSPDELCSLVESAGFNVEAIQLVGDEVKALYLKGRKP